MHRLFSVLMLSCLLLLCTWCGFGNSEPSPSPAADVPQAPDRQSIDWEYQIAHQRGIEVVTWGIPAVSMLRFRDAYFSLGGGNTVYYLSKPPTAKQETLTANNQTPYAVVTMNTKAGPVVLDIPPASDRTAIFGSAKIPLGAKAFAGN
jgi:hypothetical protein